MPLPLDRSSYEQPVGPPEEEYASYPEQFLRGLGHGATLGFWQPFSGTGKGGLVETAGNIAGSGLSFIPVARGVGAGVGALGALAPKLLRPGIEAGQAVANMAKTGRQIGPSLSGLGSALAIGGAVPLHSELMGLSDETTPPPLRERLLTTALGAGLGALGGKMLNTQATREAASTAAKAAASGLTSMGTYTSREAAAAVAEQIKTVESKLAGGGSPKDIKQWQKDLIDLRDKHDMFVRSGGIETPPSTLDNQFGGGVTDPRPSSWNDWLDSARSVKDTGLPNSSPYPRAFEPEGLWRPPTVPKAPFEGSTADVSSFLPKEAAAPVDESFAGWQKAQITRKPWEAQQPVGEWMKENLPAEFLHGGEYAAHLGEGIRVPEGPETYTEWLKRQIQWVPTRLRAEATPLGIDETSLHTGIQLSNRGTRMSDAVTDVVNAVQGTGVPPGDVLHTPMSGGSGDPNNWPSGRQILAPGFGNTLRSAMIWADKNIGRWTQIAPLRAMLMGIPGAENIPDAMALASIRIKSMRQNLLEQIPGALNWDKPTADTMRKLFTNFAGKPPEEFYAAVAKDAPAAMEGAQQLRPIMEGIWNRYVADGVLEKEQRVLNYFPLVRERLEVQTTGIQMVERGQGYMPKSLDNILAGLDPQFAKTRRYTGAEDYAINVPIKDVLSLYMTQFARHSVIHDMAPELGEMLAAVPNNYKNQIRDHTNYWLGRDTPDISNFNKYMRDYNFIRTIGFNVLSPIVNRMQMINTWAVVSPESFFQGVRDMKDPAKLEFLRSKGLEYLLSPKPNLLEDAMWDVSQPELGSTLWRKTKDWSGRMFQSSEKPNRIHALMAGMREAEKKGMTNPDEAFKYAWSVMTQTQFDLGDQAANLPAAFRSAPGRLIGQFQTFKLNQLHFMGRLLDQAREGAMTGDPAKMLDGFTPFIKFWAPAVLMAGGAGMIPGDWGEDTVTRAILGKAVHIPGLMELMFGVALPSAGLGVGMVDAGDLNSFISFFPGPTAGLIQGLVGAASGIDVGHGLDLSRVGRELSTEERSRLIVSSLPGGVQANRVLGMLRLLQNDGKYQRALDFGEFVGLEKPMGPLISDKALSLEQTLLSSMGLQTHERQQQFKELHRLTEIQDDRRRVLAMAAQLQAAGKGDEAMDAINVYNRKWGDVPHAQVSGPTLQALKSAVKAQTLPPELRRKLPKEMRGIESELTPPALLSYD